MAIPLLVKGVVARALVAVAPRVLQVATPALSGAAQVLRAAPAVLSRAVPLGRGLISKAFNAANLLFLGSLAVDGAKAVGNAIFGQGSPFGFLRDESRQTHEQRANAQDPFASIDLVVKAMALVIPILTIIQHAAKAILDYLANTPVGQIYQALTGISNFVNGLPQGYQPLLAGAGQLPQIAAPTVVFGGAESADMTQTQAASVGQFTEPAAMPAQTAHLPSLSFSPASMAVQMDSAQGMEQAQQKPAVAY